MAPVAHRLRRWPSIKPALVQRLVFAGLHDALNQSWVIVGPPSVTLAHIRRQHGNPILG